MVATSLDFGWYPHPLNFSIGNITVTTLPDLHQKADAICNHDCVDGNWLYAPPQPHGSGQRPYASRIFGLPKTHNLNHQATDDPEHVKFLVWALSFILGMRLTTTCRGFLDATPTKRRNLTDFSVPEKGYSKALDLAEVFWQANTNHPPRAKRWMGAVNALFMARYPQALQFERFIYLYGALDTCFALAKDLHPVLKSKKPQLHSHRVEHMCSVFNMPVPPWAKVLDAKSQVSCMRNMTFHETLYMDAPLGFAIYGEGTAQNLTLEMGALVCRYLVALIGNPLADYVRVPATAGEMQSWIP